MEIKNHNLKFKSLTKRSQTKEIILHCSANKEGQDVTVEAIHKYHTNVRGWSGIGYHYYIGLDGMVYSGRPENCVGAHCTNHNSYAIGICYCGGLDKTGKSKDTRTKAQKESMYKLVKMLLDKYKLKLSDVRCHYEFAAKSCPCFKKEDFYKEYEEFFKS